MGRGKGTPYGVVEDGCTLTKNVLAAELHSSPCGVRARNYSMLYIREEANDQGNAICGTGIGQGNESSVGE